MVTWRLGKPLVTWRLAKLFAILLHEGKNPIMLKHVWGMMTMLMMLLMMLLTSLVGVLLNRGRPTKQNNVERCSFITRKAEHHGSAAH